MTEVPKIVYDRLRAAVPERAHPDADLLSAFAEQALSATERDGVLQHLALCGDCREVVALALPAADLAPPQAADEDGIRTTVLREGSRASHKLSFAWPSLRWAALAAGVAVAAAVLLVHPGKLNQATLPSVNPQVATTAPPASGPQTASSSVPSSAPSSPIASSPTDQRAVSAKTDEAQPKSELRLSKKLKAGQVVTPSARAESGMLLADNMMDSRQTPKRSAAPSASAPAFGYDARSSRAATETVEVSGAAAAATIEPSAENVLTARNNAPRNDAPAIEKAKPAPQEMETNNNNEEQKAQAAAVPGPARVQARNVMSAAKLASPASPTQARNVIWAITAGVLQRSLDSGQSWQDALHADHPLLCYSSHDEDVWTGGQAGILFHSANSGVTWVQLQPSIKARQLSSDITHIDVRNDEFRDGLRDNARGPAEILLSTSNNEIWSSADGGKTWDKKTWDKK
jgi:Putative zinc-finger